MKIIVLSKRAAALILVACVLAVSLVYGYRESIATATRYVIEVMAQTNRLVPIYRVQQTEKKLSISFDACWGADKTEEILSILKENGDIKTTFFLTGFWLEKYPDMVKKIAEAGHEIGNHSFTHPHLNSLSEQQIKEEVTKTHNLIYQLTGQSPTLFRPPFGEYSNKVITTIESLNYKVIQWDVDSLDWKTISTENIVKRVTSQVSPGSIVLFHNNGENTTDALRQILPKLKAEGYQIVPISELIYQDNYYIDKHTGEQKPKE
ncbi:MAG TPA: polysaccharide deacetylase family protein [Clostridia bacterium]|nr:polysaccharide deacetylase family protein [Clostridia bacterium]